MSLAARLKRQSTMTWLGACFFLGAITLLFIAVYHEAIRTGPVTWIAAVCLMGAIACWAASARAGTREE